jgi:acetyltransferase-like isoleucine patch superfamily enzyme
LPPSCRHHWGQCPDSASGREGCRQKRQNGASPGSVLHRSPLSGLPGPSACSTAPYRPAPGIHPTAVIDPTATYGEQRLYRSPCRGSGRGAAWAIPRLPPSLTSPSIPKVRVGDGTVLHANCSYPRAGRTLEPGASSTVEPPSGLRALALYPPNTGWEKMEQSGITVLEDGVEVGCNTTIDRPAVGETRIRRGTKIDNLVQIGHGCQVGDSVTVMAAQVGLAGGVTVGSRVILAGQVGVANQATIGDGAIATAKAGIHNDVSPPEKSSPVFRPCPTDFISRLLLSTAACPTCTKPCKGFRSSRLNRKVLKAKWAVHKQEPSAVPSAVNFKELNHGQICSMGKLRRKCP